MREQRAALWHVALLAGSATAKLNWNLEMSFLQTLQQ